MLVKMISIMIDAGKDDKAEAQKPRQRVSIANRKIFARPENFCAYDIKGYNFVSILSGRF